uniref:Major allergen I polypeptide chain 1-like n=1 Tax=Moschus moschiferus TaxID=68415 RepID=A0A8C6CGD6_MOSMO
MTRAGALLLLCAALLLITGGKCDDLCPALRDNNDLFILGSHDTYVEQVAKYNQDSDILESASTLNSCVDEKLTPQDKQDAVSALNKIYSSSLCRWSCSFQEPKEAIHLITK